MKTRERIMAKVLSAFNERGYHAFSLADLAQLCDMSRGNLAYHYKSKEAILDDISVKLNRDIKRFQRQKINFPAFYNLNLDIRTCRSLQKWYPFIFRDMSILEYSAIKDVMSNWSKDVIKSNLSTFAYGIETGHVKEEANEGLYYLLSINAWLIIYYWVAQESVRKQGKEEPEKLIWSAIYPHFTSKGMSAFFDYYGSDFLSKSGIPISHYMELKHII